MDQAGYLEELNRNARSTEHKNRMESVSNMIFAFVLLRRVHWYVVTDAWWRGEIVASLSAYHLTGLAFGRRNSQEWHTSFGRYLTL